MTLAQARALAALLEQAAALPVELLYLAPAEPTALVETTDHGDGLDLEVMLRHEPAVVLWPTALYLSGRGGWHVWNGETNEEEPVDRFGWRPRAHGGAFCALDADGTVLSPYLQADP